MMVARVEIWPFGEYRRRRRIGTLKVANLGPVDDRDGYTMYAAILEDGKREKWAYVEHRRENGAFALVQKALEVMR
jgi:hypothetical protein